jgi:hypothetical protein
MTGQEQRRLSGLFSQSTPEAAWHALEDSRVILVEVACSPASVLSEEVIKQKGEGSAIRCSHWNGCDLRFAEGVRNCKEVISRTKPKHIWISTECGPFSPLQNLNKKTEEQRENLRAKRADAMKQYEGGMAVARHGRSLGAHIHWEWSQKCEAWRLPAFQEFQKELQLKRATCAGCMVGLKDPKTSKLMKKGWSIATTSSIIHSRLELPCQQNHEHISCEHGRPGATAYYTPEFGRRVSKALLESEPWGCLLDIITSIPVSRHQEVWSLQRRSS